MAKTKFLESAEADESSVEYWCEMTQIVTEEYKLAKVEIERLRKALGLLPEGEGDTE